MKCIWRKAVYLGLLCMAMVIGISITTEASGILKIQLDHGNKSNWSEGIQIPEVTVNSSVVSPEWSKDLKDWKPGKKVTVTLKIPGTYTDSDCFVAGGELLSAVTKDGETIIKISYTPVAKLATTEKAGWSDTAKTRAVWKKVPFASMYQIVIYDQGGAWMKSMTVSSNAVDFSPYMEDGKRYYYSVKAVLKDSSEEAYLQEGEPVLSDDSVVQELGETNGIWRVYKEGKKYEGEDGTYAFNTWKMINGRWYYFDHDGFAITGWQFIHDKWYYLDSDGVMVTGWKKLDETWYYLNENGDMATGWIQTSPGEWYYLNPDGSMAADTMVDGIYRVDGSGLWME